jgi:glycosyltransferase involved in cell wall biosynthesis
MGAVLHQAVRMRIAALAPFPFHDAEFGGGERIDNLLTRIDGKVRVFVPNYGGEARIEHKNLDISFHTIPPELRKSEYDLSVVASAKQMFGQLLKDYEPDLVILEHPWQVEALDGQKFIYDAHNNETQMKKLISGEDVVKETMRVEELALQANHVTYCSEDDGLAVPNKTWIPNGTDLPATPNKVGKENRTLLFTGSAHPPNIGAAIMLAGLAAGLPDYQIVIAGECSRYVQTDLPNVSLLGHVNKPTLDYLFRTSHAFVNPMAAGSGTSLKVIKALSYGLPVVSSPIGARGFTEACIVAKTGQEVIEKLDLLRSAYYWENVSKASLELAKAFSWDVLGARFNQVIQSA